MDIRTLVVDDDQDSCDLIERILKKEGYRVVTLTDPRRVEDELRRTEVHLAIVDLKMPDLSGLDVAQIIKRHDSDCSVILMTGYATLDSAVSALRYGVVDYLKKPVREDELVGAVRRALAAKGLSLLPEEELHRNIGSAIRDLRKKRTLTLKQLAGLREAMAGVTAAGGTAASAGIQGLVIAGKTGSAQNTENPNKDHAWFVGFAPAENPKVVVAVFLEFGIHGYLAARVASKIIGFYTKAAPVELIDTGG